MPTYVTLVQFTDKGLSTIKDGPARLDDARKRFEALGAKMKAFYLTMGQYDAVVIADAPDDQTQAQLALAIGAGGNSRSETLRAFTEEEYRQLVQKLP